MFDDEEITVFDIENIGKYFGKKNKMNGSDYILYYTKKIIWNIL